MSTSPLETSPPPRFRLRTFGTLRLVGPADDTILGEHGHQRRRLALLAVLAASGERGRSRDKLLGLFWPDIPQLRARHSLEQLVYAIRTSLDEKIFAGMNPISLNPTFIGSDIGDFTSALDRSELEVAVDLYRGPFLEGFYLTDAPEFEQWLDAERGLIERKYSGALERLAKTAEDKNDFSSAAQWLQKLIDTDPVSSKHAAGLIRALMNAGDHAAALKYAERYETIVGQELGTSVGPAVAGLVAEVRARAKSESVIVRGDVTQSRARAAAEPSAALSANATDAVPANEAQASGLSRAPRRVRPAFYGLGVLGLATVLVAFVWWRSHSVNHAAAASVATPSIAVLPLLNVSGDSRDAPLVDGLTEEMIGVLAKIDRLRVVAPMSAFVFKNSDLGVRRIADSLRVSNVLQGGVQKVGQNIRVQVRLVDARDGSTRWSETYNRELKDIFVVQSEIAAAVARELDLRLTGSSAAAIRRQPTQNIAAYELFLRGNDPALLRSDSATLLGVEYFKQAIALDPAYAPAYTGLARMYRTLLVGERAKLSAHDLQALAEQAARKGVSLNDSLGEAHAILGAILMARYDFTAVDKELKRAVAIDPGDARTRRILARLYEWQKRPADALAETRHGAESDPLSPSAHAEVAQALCADRQYDEGLARLKRIDAVKPPLRRMPLYRAICHGMKGDWPAAVAALRQSRENRGRGLLGFGLARSGEREAALGILADLTNHWQRTKQGAFEVALVHEGLGNRSQAIDWLDRSVDDLSLSEHIMLPIFDDLHADPRFARLRTRLQLQNE